MAEPVSFLTASAVVAAAGLPLALGFVPPNRLYGVRTARILADAQLWYRANRFAGLAFMAAGALSVCIFVVAPELASGRSFGGLLIIMVPLLIAFAAIAVYLRKASEERP